MPAAVDKVQHEHYHRYLWALSLCSGKKVVDVACGEGYGAALVATVAAEVVGFDKSTEAVGHAAATYAAQPNLWFKVADAVSLPVPAGSVDVVLSFETIEHLEAQDEFVSEVARILRPDGLFVLSTPNRDVYLGGSGRNEFHVRELSREELAEALAPFRHTVIGAQRSDSASVIEAVSREATPLQVHFDRAVGEAYTDSATVPAPTYFVAVASKKALPALPAMSVLFDGEYLPALHESYRAALEEAWSEANDRGNELASTQAALERAQLELEENRAAARTAQAEIEDELATIGDRLSQTEERLADADARRRELAADLELALALARRTESELSEALSAKAAAQVAQAAAEERTGAAEARDGHLEWELALVGQELERVAGSLSWRVTRPLRTLKAIVRRPARAFRSRVRRLRGTSTYRRLSRTRAADVVRRVIGRPSVAQVQLPLARELLVLPPAEIGEADAALVQRVNDWVGRARSVRAAAALDHRPLISLLMPTYNTPIALLHAAVQSILSQSYPEWELILADDGSDALDSTLEEVASWDARIRVIELGENRGISAATNAALERASGDYVAMVDHDDLVLPDALFAVARALNRDPTIDVIYTDQEYADASGAPEEPLYKPDWDPYLFCGVMYVGHLLVVRRSIAIAAGGFNSVFDNVQDFEFMLRVSELTDRIAHVPEIHYRWRRVQGSVALRGDAKSNIEQLQSRAVAEHLVRLSVPATARPHARFAHRSQLVPTEEPREPCTVIFGPCVSDTVVARAPGHVETFAWGPAADRVVSAGFAQTAVEQLPDAIRAAGNDLLVLLDPGLEPTDDGWLDHLWVYATRENVFAASGIVVTSTGIVETSGWLTTSHGFAPAHRGHDAKSDGYAGSLSCARVVSGVDGRCLMVSGTTVEMVGGLKAYYDSSDAAWLDLSLRAETEGLCSVVTPCATFTRRDGVPATVTRQDEILLVDRWRDRLQRDPHHNPNFDSASGGYRIAAA